MTAVLAVVLILALFTAIQMALLAGVVIRRDGWQGGRHFWL